MWKIHFIKLKSSRKLGEWLMVSEIEKLEEQINLLREELIQIAKASGLNSNATLRYSQELDDLITMYQKSKNKQYKKV